DLAPYDPGSLNRRCRHAHSCQTVMLPLRAPDRRPIDQGDSTFNGSRHGSLECGGDKRPPARAAVHLPQRPPRGGHPPPTYTAWPVVIFVRILGRAQAVSQSCSCSGILMCSVVALAGGLMICTG